MLDPRHGPVPTNTTVLPQQFTPINITISRTPQENLTVFRGVIKPEISTALEPLYLLTLIPLIALILMLILLVIRLKYTPSSKPPIIAPLEGRKYPYTTSANYFYGELRKIIRTYYLEALSIINKYVKTSESETPREILNKLKLHKFYNVFKEIVKIYEETIYSPRKPSENHVKSLSKFISLLKKGFTS